MEDDDIRWSEWRVVREYMSERECNKWKFDCSFSFLVKQTNLTLFQLLVKFTIN